MTIKQSKEDLLRALQENVQFIIASSRSFDSGFKSEAKRLSVAIRVLVHDTSRSTSLLTQLGKNDIPFYDTGYEYNPKNLVTQLCLLWLKAGGTTSEYIPLLYDVFKLDKAISMVRKVTFNTWWNKIVIVDSNRDTFTRKDLILVSANKDGGAHTDPTLDEKYVNISRLYSHGWQHVVGSKEIDFANRPVLPTIRHIAFEVLLTLQDAFP